MPLNANIVSRCITAVLFRLLSLFFYTSNTCFKSNLVFIISVQNSSISLNLMDSFFQEGLAFLLVSMSFPWLAALSRGKVMLSSQPADNTS